MNKCRCDQCNFYLRKISSKIIKPIHKRNYAPPKQEELHLSARNTAIVSTMFTTALVKRSPVKQS